MAQRNVSGRERERAVPAQQPIGRAVNVLKDVLIDVGPPVLKTKFVYGPKGKEVKENRFQFAGDENHSGEHDPHLEGRGVDVVLVADRVAERAEAYDLVRLFLLLRETMRWSTMIYNKQEWGGSGSAKPRLYRAITTEEAATQKGKAQYSDAKAKWEHVSHIHIDWSYERRDLTEWEEAVRAAVRRHQTLDDTIEKLPALLAGTWKVVWGNDDYTAYAKFDVGGGIGFSETPTSKAFEVGRWNADAGDLRWRLTTNPGDIRTFVVELPIENGQASGLIMPEGQGWFKMSKR